MLLKKKILKIKYDHQLSLTVIFYSDLFNININNHLINQHDNLMKKIYLELYVYIS